MQLTTEDKARVFFSYYGAEYSYKNEWGTFYNTVIKDNANLYKHIETAKLHLYDLSDITDEDRTEIAKITGEKKSDVYGWLNHDSIGYGKCSHKWDCLQVFDYLRSKGYHLPYKSINLFDAGIAIRKTR